MDIYLGYATVPGIEENRDQNLKAKNMKLEVLPNIVNHNAEIYYQINSSGITNLSVYDITGRKVKSFINGNFEQGCYKVNWDGTDDAGRKLPEGVYFIRLDNQTEVKTQKVIIIR